MPKRDWKGRIEGDYSEETADKAHERRQIAQILKEADQRLAERLRADPLNLVFWDRQIEEALATIDQLHRNLTRYYGYKRRVQKGLEDASSDDSQAADGDEAGALDARTGLDVPGKL